MKRLFEKKKLVIAKFSYSDNESNSDSAQFVDVQKGSENNATISDNENNATISYNENNATIVQEWVKGKFLRYGVI